MKYIAKYNRNREKFRKFLVAKQNKCERIQDFCYDCKIRQITFSRRYETYTNKPFWRADRD